MFLYPASQNNCSDVRIGYDISVSVNMTFNLRHVTNSVFFWPSLFRTHLAIIHESVSHANGDDIVDVETCVGVDDQRHRAFAHQHLHSKTLFLLIRFDWNVFSLCIEHLAQHKDKM